MTQPDPTIVAARERVYGPPHVGFASLGRTWAAMLSDHFQKPVEDIPPHVVSLMLGALKLHRAAKPFDASLDSYVDAHNYISLAAELDPRLKEVPGASRS